MVGAAKRNIFSHSSSLESKSRYIEVPRWEPLQVFNAPWHQDKRRQPRCTILSLRYAYNNNNTTCNRQRVIPTLAFKPREFHFSRKPPRPPRWSDFTCTHLRFILYVYAAGMDSSAEFARRFSTSALILARVRSTCLINDSLEVSVWLYGFNTPAPKPEFRTDVLIQLRRAGRISKYARYSNI